MADGMREKTTNVGGVIKRIWYAMTGATQGAELMSIDDTGKFKCVSEQITGLAGTGSRMVVADSSGNLSAAQQRTEVVNFTGLTTSFQLAPLPQLPTNGAFSYSWTFSASGLGHAAINSTHNLFVGVEVFSQFTGCTVVEVIPNSNYSFRLGDSVIEIKIVAASGEVYLKRNSGTITNFKIERTIQNI